MTRSKAEIEAERASWQNAIDQGIAASEVAIDRNSRDSRFVLIMMLVVVLGLASTGGLVSQFGSVDEKELARLTREVTATNLAEYVSATKSRQEIARTILIGAGSLGIIFAGLLIALYRFYMFEAAKYEHFRLGFLRTRIALSYSESDEDATVALLRDAFQYTAPWKQPRTSVESPLPGTPISDTIAFTVNRVLEEVGKRLGRK